jgi:thiamine monophosphate synthase
MLVKNVTKTEEYSDIATARENLNNRIIGVSVSSSREALEALYEGADYLGIGSVYPTPTYVGHHYAAKSLTNEGQ